MSVRHISYQVGKRVDATFDVMHHGGIIPTTINEEEVYTIRNTNVILKKMDINYDQHVYIFKVIYNPDQI